METAYRMQFAAAEAFDLTRESQTVRDEYGTTHFSNGCLLARLSGSGATCFGLFAEKRDAEFAARNLSRAYPKWWTAATAAG